MHSQRNGSDSYRGSIVLYSQQKRFPWCFWVYHFGRWTKQLLKKSPMAAFCFVISKALIRSPQNTQGLRCLSFLVMRFGDLQYSGSCLFYSKLASIPGYIHWVPEVLFMIGHRWPFQANDTFFLMSIEQSTNWWIVPLGLILTTNNVWEAVFFRFATVG